MSSRNVTPRIAFRTDNYELCRSLVGQGLGYTLLLKRDISPDAWDGGRVSVLPITPRPRPVHILVAWPDRQLPPRAAAVVDAVTEITKEASLM